MPYLKLQRMWPLQRRRHGSTDLNSRNNSKADAEAMIGFAATPPFGSLVVVGTGGTMVELQADKAVRLRR